MPAAFCQDRSGAEPEDTRRQGGFLPCRNAQSNQNVWYGMYDSHTSCPCQNPARQCWQRRYCGKTDHNNVVNDGHGQDKDKNTDSGTDRTRSTTGTVKKRWGHTR